VTRAQESASFVHIFRYVSIAIGFATASRFQWQVDSFRRAHTMIATCRPEKAARFVFPGRSPAQTFSDRHEQERQVFH
jgi:hypothetical protein